MSLYDKSVALWGDELPNQITDLEDKSDESVYSALNMIMADILAPNWTQDAQKAWKLMTMEGLA